jgi:hypothetical protein
MRLQDLLKYVDDIDNRRKGIRIWLVLVLTWSLGRSIVVTRVFEQYGLNPAIYFAIDFLSSIPYAYASAQTLLAFIDKQRNRILAWGLLTLVTFYLPDIYIVIASQHVPTFTYFGFAMILTVLSALAYKQWNEKRR